MPATVYAVANQEGGVAKTTTVVSARGGVDRTGSGAAAYRMIVAELAGVDINDDERAAAFGGRR